jgi:hypothetical protein
MSFVSELSEIVDKLWPLLEDYCETLDAIRLDVDMATGEIRVELESDDGSMVDARIDWQEDVETLAERLRSAISVEQAGYRGRALASIESAKEGASYALAIADGLKGLIPSPLEELAQQAE